MFAAKDGIVGHVVDYQTSDKWAYCVDEIRDITANFRSWQKWTYAYDRGCHDRDLFKLWRAEDVILCYVMLCLAHLGDIFTFTSLYTKYNPVTLPLFFFNLPFVYFEVNSSLSTSPNCSCLWTTMTKCPLQSWSNILHQVPCKKKKSNNKSSKTTTLTHQRKPQWPQLQHELSFSYSLTVSAQCCRWAL